MAHNKGCPQLFDPQLAHTQLECGVQPWWWRPPRLLKCARTRESLSACTGKALSFFSERYAYWVGSTNACQWKPRWHIKETHHPYMRGQWTVFFQNLVNDVKDQGASGPKDQGNQGPGHQTTRGPLIRQLLFDWILILYIVIFAPYEIWSWLKEAVDPAGLIACQPDTFQGGLPSIPFSKAAADSIPTPLPAGKNNAGSPPSWFKK